MEDIFKKEAIAVEDQPNETNALLHEIYKELRKSNKKKGKKGKNGKKDKKIQKLKKELKKAKKQNKGNESKNQDAPSFIGGLLKTGIQVGFPTFIENLFDKKGR